MKQVTSEIVHKALEKLKPVWGLDIIMPDIEIEIPRNESLGDITTTVAMSLTRTLKKPPGKIAEELLQEINQLGGPFEKVEIAGPGFINFRFKKQYLYERVKTLLTEGHSSLSSNPGQGRKIQIEFVSANPTGPLHIGHGRGAAMGSALSNLLRAAGFDVEREYYINDAGLQVKLLGQSVYARYQQLLGNEVPFPEDGYKGAYIGSISKELIEKSGDKYLKLSFEECGDFFTDNAYKMLLADISKDLKDFGVEFDRWQSEKALYEKNRVEESLNELREKGFIYEKDGAKWFRSSDFGDEKDRVVVKKDGEYTYFAPDIAYHKDKLDRGFDTIIDIWGADHHGYVPRIRSVLEAFGLAKEKFRVMLIQMVSLLRHGEPVQMSKRAGKFITLREVIDEVGSDTAKFIFLTRKADSHLDFDLEVAKEESSENPVFYVQYAFARISSIFRRAEERGVRSPKTGVKIEDLTVLKEDEEMSLIKKLLQYPLVIEGAAHAFEPHRVTYYLQDLAKLFHSYYNKHRVLSDDNALTRGRLCLCRAVQIVLKEGLKLLGVSAPKKM
ncbi:arginine--tRNA ligase [bacterium BMS3Abin10]|nr:arginine--tRNA ligase [bacterium BMS3Abin10]GBE38464.1 arginine--tRNA ligase [bacterium BMS3Bbin08]HDH05113.1 arginine--tRNA ligase [Nitrospirota bacterium]HDK16900.1 arginine--tRNA ligase [Nitrospirota bacterium]